MQYPRRFLPPIQVLTAFEASARLGSFTAAAEELNLTQSAVSRQIKTLEELLGGDVFVRERHMVRLTVAGEAYAHEIREVLRRICGATLGFRANPSGGTLNLAILPTFGTRWLAPRLPRFVAANPGITINLVTRIMATDFRLDSVDAAIHYGTADGADAEFDYLMSEEVFPACSRAMRDEYKFQEPADLLKAPLLHLISRPDAWEKWFSYHGLPWVKVHGMLVDQFALATQAAIAGLGVALLPEFLFQQELQRGDLVAAVDAKQPGAGRYFLAYTAARKGYPPLEAFRQWLQEETAQFRPHETAS